jgi:hypothetical protein
VGETSADDGKQSLSDRLEYFEAECAALRAQVKQLSRLRDDTFDRQELGHKHTCRNCLFAQREENETTGEVELLCRSHPPLYSDDNRRVVGDHFFCREWEPDSLYDAEALASVEVESETTVFSVLSRNPGWEIRCLSSKRGVTVHIRDSKRDINVVSAVEHGEEAKAASEVLESLEDKLRVIIQSRSKGDE